MNGYRKSTGLNAALAAALLCAGAGIATGQTNNPFAPPTAALDTLNDGAVPGGNVALERANAVAAPTTPPPGAPADPAAAAAPGGAPAAGAPRGASALGQAGDAVERVIKPRIQAIYGVRVFDAITGELLDDPQLMRLAPEEIETLGLVDDGTNGDIIPEDGQYANVRQSFDYVGQSNQRLKERLIKAIITAEQLTPLEFYGYHVLTTERHNPAPRNRRWSMVDAGRGLGKTLAEVDTDKPLQIPKAREVEERKDEKIAGKDGWAIRYLDEYRKQKGDIRSEFYPVYIPLPPVPPSIPPPPKTSNWKPFPKPAGQTEQAKDDAFSKYGYKIKPQDLPEGAPTSQPYFNSNLTQKGFGVDTSRR